MIRVENLSLGHGLTPILNDVSFEVQPGETLAIIGESGSGKTSLARLLMGLLPGGSNRAFHWKGRAFMGEMDVLNASRRAMNHFRGRQAGLIVQALSDALNPHMRIRQHLREIVLQHRLALTAEEICATWHIPTRLLDRYPLGVSGGEIQRVLTALALLPAPRFLILDEPTAALDVANRAHAIAGFRRGSDTRCQILITHDLDLARALSDRVAVLKAGRIVETGPTLSVFRQPSHDYTRLLIKSALPSIPPAVAAGPDATEAGLHIRNLCHSVAGRWVFQDLQVSIPEGSCLAVLGESGSGKTTLSRLVAGMEDIQSGAILWRRGGRETSFRAALVCQHPHRAMARHFSVAQVLGEALDLKQKRTGKARLSDRQRSRQIFNLLETVGLPWDDRFLDRRSAALSGGEAQRLVIARALAMNPDILVADEPTAALDMISRSQVLDLLRRLKEERRLTILLATHDTAAAGYLSDRSLNL